MEGSLVNHLLSTRNLGLQKFQESSRQLENKAMEVSQLHPYSMNVMYNSHPLPLPLLFPYYQYPENYVHWTQTPESHIYSADLPGVRKEEIKVEVEDSRYLIIRTEREVMMTITDQPEGGRSFKRKFRLPGRVDLEGISAGYENGVLTVTVPKSHVRRGFFIDPSDMPDNTTLQVTARAA